MEHRETLDWSGGSHQGEVRQHSQSEYEIPSSLSLKSSQPNLSLGRHVIFWELPPNGRL